jgi:hypothetical protein
MATIAETTISYGALEQPYPWWIHAKVVQKALSGIRDLISTIWVGFATNLDNVFIVCFRIQDGFI